MPEDDPHAQHERQKLLQRIVAQVHEDHAGGDVDAAREALSRTIAEEGFPEQPAKWVDDTAAEISQGRHVVVDRELGVGGGSERSTEQADDQIDEETS